MTGADGALRLMVRNTAVVLAVDVAGVAGVLESMVVVRRRLFGM